MAEVKVMSMVIREKGKLVPLNWWKNIMVMGDKRLSMGLILVEIKVRNRKARDLRKISILRANKTNYWKAIMDSELRQCHRITKWNRRRKRKFYN